MEPIVKEQVWGDWSGRLDPERYLHNDIYLSREILEDERQRIFHRVWIFCAHESEMAGPGSYVTTTVAGTPILLIRGEEGEIRAFLNICPHRGAMMVRRPAGEARSLTCLFHRWSFSTAGECLSVPQPAGFEEVGLDRSQFGLRPVRVATKLGFIFVTLNDEADPLEDYLGDVLETVEDVLTPQPMEVFHYHRIVIPSNWKLWAATNLELYHVWLHSLNRATSLQAQNWLQRRPLCYPNGHTAFEPARHEYAKRKLGTRDLTLPNLGPNEARLAHVFPDFLINIRSSSMRLDRVTPLDPDRVMVEFRGLALKGEPESDRKRRIKEYNEFWGPFGRNLPEDAIAIVEQMKAMRAGALKHSLCAREDGDTPATSDEPMRHFHREWSRLMGRPASEPFVGGREETERLLSATAGAAI